MGWGGGGRSCPQAPVVWTYFVLFYKCIVIPSATLNNPKFLGEIEIPEVFVIQCIQLRFCSQDANKCKNQYIAYHYIGWTPGWDICWYWCGLKNILIEILSPVLNFKIWQFVSKNYVWNYFGKVTIFKSPAGFELMSLHICSEPSTHCASL